MQCVQYATYSSLGGCSICLPIIAIHVFRTGVQFSLVHARSSSAVNEPYLTYQVLRPPTANDLKMIHTVTPDKRKLSYLCRVRFGSVNWIPDNSRLAPTENLKSEQ